MAIKQLFFTSFLFILFSCHSSHEPEKVKGIPVSAFWAGGSDGGNWFVIEKIDTAAEIIHLKIYHDFTGELLIDKPFILICKSNTSIDWGNIKNLISSFDGKIVYLQTANKANKYCYFQ